MRDIIYKINSYEDLEKYKEYLSKEEYLIALDRVEYIQLEINKMIDEGSPVPSNKRRLGFFRMIIVFLRNRYFFRLKK